MTDLELIKFMWKLLYDDLGDGDTPNEKQVATLLHELARRGILEDKEWPC